MLTLERIQELANLPKVRKIAVENFLHTSTPTLAYADALANLAMDARLYNWNTATVSAIRKGLQEMYR